MPVKTIYELELHEVTVIHKNIRVMRVPGGWIYERLTRKISDTENEAVAIFVPYNAEYAPS